MSKTLSEVVYRHLFSDGAIPFACKCYIPAIDTRIKEIEELAQGKVIEGFNRRISDRAASRQLTQQIVQLRDSISPPMSYRDIVRRLGNCITPDAARNRYNDATVRKDQIVEEYPKVQPKKALDLTPSEAGKQNGPKIPHIEDDFILQSRDEGKSFGEILEALKAKGIMCTYSDVAVRYHNEKNKRKRALNVETQNVAPKHPDTTNSPSLPGAEGARDEARANPRGPPEETRPEPKIKSISRSELDEKIWKAWKEGKTVKQISDDLYSESLYYSEKSVRMRLLQQGADFSASNFSEVSA